MKTLFCFLLLFPFTYLSLIGQTDTPASTQWGITAGWTEAFTSDQHFSPLLYQSDVLTMGGIYRSENKQLFEVRLTFQLGTNQARRLGKRDGTFKETPDLFGVQESYDYTVNPFLSRFNGQLSIKFLWPVSTHSQLGFSFRTRYDLAGMAGDTWQYAQLDLGPAFRSQLPLWKGNVQLAAGLPLMATVVRPNWALDASLSDETNYFKGWLRTGTSIASLDKLFNPRIQAGYAFKLEDGREIGAYYHLQWTSYSEPRPLRMFEHGVLATYFW